MEESGTGAVAPSRWGGVRCPACARAAIGRVPNRV